jgi:hypothetical protein
MRELGKYFRIYCHTTHKKWPELVPYIQGWLNASVIETTGYAPLELLGGHPRPDIFSKLLKKEIDQLPVEDTLANKVLKAYARSKLKAEKRNRKRKSGRTRWLPKLSDLVLVKSQPISDATQGIIGKFQRPFEGPFIVQKVVNPALFELQDEEGKCRGLFNLRHLKPYLKADEDG